MTALLDAALAYADLGWPVLPLHAPTAAGSCTCGHKDCSSPAKHPRLQHGLHEASTDVDTIVAWWRRWPNANVGLRTGEAFDVLDVDGEEGRQSILGACAEHGELPHGPWSLTGGGGDHLLFLPTGAGNRAGILPKVDWRGVNGYIVAPPSLHASGEHYTWQEGPENELQAPPAWLAALVAPKPLIVRPDAPVRFLPAGSGDGSAYGVRALEAEIGELARSAVGMRNHSLNGCAFNLYQLVAGGELQEGAVTDRLRSTAIGIGLGDAEVEKTLASARRGGIAAPRSAPELRMVVGGEPLPPEPEADYEQDYEPVPDEVTDEAPEPDQDIDTFLNEDEPDYDWIIPGLLERGDRVILTGAEGSGKSTLLRQIAIQCGAGIHPFTLEPMAPIRVMYVDLENSKRQVRRKIRPLRLVVKDLDPMMIRVRIVTQGIDLLRPDHQAFLEERIQVNAPDLLIMGPLYKLVGDDPVKEEPARIAAMALDHFRLKYGFALLMEAHSPHGVGASQTRPERPYGASLWMRWPEFGFFIDGETGQLRHWRGPRDERDWPAVLQRGGEWPWTAVTNVKALTFASIVDEVRNAGKRLSVRELADRIKGDRNQVQRAIDANRKQWESVLNELNREEF